MNECWQYWPFIWCGTITGCVLFIIYHLKKVRNMKNETAELMVAADLEIIKLRKSSINYESPEARYRKDPIFKALSDMCYNTLSQGFLEVDDLISAMTLARIQFESKTVLADEPEKNVQLKYDHDEKFREVVDNTFRLLMKGQSSLTELREAIQVAMVRLAIMSPSTFHEEN